jgi:HD-like signal output (HDOD) protein
VAKQLATLVGGTLEVESTAEWSSVFRFRFSAGTRMLGRSSPHNAPARAPGSERVIRPVSSRSAVRGAPNCSPFPPILGMIARALQDPTGDDRGVRRAVRSDEALSLTLLNYANAASVARVRPAKTSDDALSVVGLSGLRAIVLTKFVQSLFTRWGVAEEFLWEHALASAIAAQRLRTADRDDSEELYLCGLLHNVGKVLLNAENPTRYGDVLLSVSEVGEEFCQAEHAFFGTTHPAFGAELVRDAGIPAIVKEVVAHHHDPAVAKVGTRALCRTLLLADAIAYRVSPAWASLRGTREEPRWIAQRIDDARDALPPDALPPLLESVRTELEDARALLRR